MTNSQKKPSLDLAEHFFRNEYGRMVAVITKYLGAENVETAEDIVQETLLKAVENWQHHGLPENPQAWLYKTARNLSLNILKRKKLELNYKSKKLGVTSLEIEPFEFSEEQISDEQLKMMFACCHPSISSNSQITLILKILCGFSIAEISNAFFTSKETINKRLVRGRKELRVSKIDFSIHLNQKQNLPVVLKTIFLLFNEGYYPSHKNEIIRFDLCIEAIRLCEILESHSTLNESSDCKSLLALMYLNASRFDARINEANSNVDLQSQDRGKWNQDLINKGILKLKEATSESQVSVYLILATISAQHCISSNYKNTDWMEILSLYDSLIKMEDTAIVRLNRSIAIYKVKGVKAAIGELQKLEKKSEIGQNQLFHSTLAEFCKLDNQRILAKEHYNKALGICKNPRDQQWLENKIKELVPII